ncbi:MAG: PilN domain-containing protein [Armatimonadota bacterium]|nr:MAG: PilN domain-containing protein [Armatimonadota bacterium]
MTSININLIAERRAQKQRSAKLLRLAGYTVLSLIVVIGVMYAYFTIAIGITQGEVVECAAKLSDPKFRADLQRIEYLEQHCAALEPRVNLLEAVHGSQQAWIAVLGDLSRCIPNNVWLTNVQSRRDQSGQSLSIAGSAASQRAVGDFMLNLKQATWCGDPVLNFTQTVGLLDQEVVNFDVTAPIKHPIGSELR